MDCNRFYFPPFYEEDNTSKILTLKIHARTSETDTGGEKNLVLFTKSSFVAAVRKKTKPSIMLLAWRCHVWTRWLRAPWRACSVAHYRTLEVTSKKKKKRKMRHLFNLQMIVPSSLRLKGALWSVERATSGACVFAGRWTAAGRTDNGGKKKLIMGQGWGGGVFERTSRELREFAKGEAEKMNVNRNVEFARVECPPEGPVSRILKEAWY